MDIHIQRDGQQMGPYNLGQINEYLAQGSLLTTDHAWHEGLPQWVALNEIAGVVSNQAATSSPPPFNPSVAAVPEKTGNKKKLLLFGGIGVGVVALITIVAVLVLGGKKESPEPQAKAAAEAKAKAAADAKVFEAAIRKSLKKPTGELTKADYEKVTELNLNHGLLTEVPKGLEKLTQLETLSIVNNQLTELPKGLEKLTQLTSLYIDGNQLTDVKGLEKLTQLTGLNLSRNQLTEVPKGLEKLTQLKYLFLDGNQLTDVKGLEKLTQLKGLHLKNNPDLTKAQIAELKKALAPKFSFMRSSIYSDYD